MAATLSHSRFNLERLHVAVEEAALGGQLERLGFALRQDDRIGDAELV
jgi:hypothetical protein